MRKMKNSGVPWIGEVPSDWSVCRIKAVADVYIGNSIKDEEKQFYEDSNDAIPYIATKDVDATLQTINYDNGMYVKSANTSFKRAPSGSTLLCIEGGSAGKKIAFTSQDVCFVNKLCCFSPIKVHGKYLYYFLMSPAFTQPFRSRISGLIGGVSVNELNGFYFLLPSSNMQKRIADFLDTECAHIDSIIEQTRASIEEYKKLKQSVITQAVTKGIRPDRKMKCSETEWIDLIPDDWNECRIKNVITPLQRPVYDDDEIVTCFRDGIVTLRKNRRESGFTVSFTESGYQGVDEGDLVIHGMDAFAGAIGCSDCRGKITPVVHVCATNGNNRFFMYFLRSMAYGNILMDLSNGVRIRSSDFRNFSKLGAFHVVEPPISEQNEIVEFLDTELTQIEKVIEEKQRLLTELESYKHSLIYEYVTGKKEVPA